MTSSAWRRCTASRPLARTWPSTALQRKQTLETYRDFAREARIAERIALAAVKDAVSLARERWPALLDTLPTPPAMRSVVLERLETLPPGMAGPALRALRWAAIAAAPAAACAPRPRLRDDRRAGVFQQPLEIRRGHDDFAGCGAQAVDGLGRQGKRRGEFIEVGQLVPILQPGERHVDGVDRRVRRAERGGDCLILVRSERRRAADLAHGRQRA